MLKYVVISLILGGIAVFSYAPFHLWFLSFISFAGLLWLIANKSKKQATLLGLTWGIGYFASGVHWVYISIKQYGELPTPLAIIILALLVAYLSLYPMLFALILRVVEKKYAPSFSFKQLVITAPIIWQLTEFLRGYIMTGFAWLQLGYSQLDSPLRGYFPVFGIDGVNLITTMACGLIVYLLYRIYFHCLKNQKSGVIHVSKVGLKQSCQRKPIFGAIFALLVIFVAPITLSAISWVQIKPTTIANLVLIQGNIAQSLRWNSQQLNKTLRTYGTLTQDNLDNNIIIWSEASITDYELNQQTFLQDLDNEARAHNAEVAVGIIDYHPKNDYSNDGDVYNTLIVLGQETPYQYPTKNRYQKQHLVPFGEFTPLASILKPIANMLNIPMSSMTPGDTLQKPLEMKGLKFTTVICYEVILSDLVWRNFEPNTDFLLTVSNDAWFGDSIGPWQHLQMAQARALEFGRPLIRSTNNGITAIIDHNGNIINQLPQFETAVLKQTLKATTGLTPYARWGNISYYTALCLMLIFLFFKRHQKY